jgi:Oxidoreductase molybdopterin binding domain
VLAHLGVAHVDPRQWRLRIDGMVERPFVVDLEELLELPARELTAVFECYGNPLRPGVAARSVANVVWRGVPLAGLLAQAGPRPQATLVHLEGMDSGTFADVYCERYVKDIPIERALDEDVLVAYAMNGAPLTPEHGFPARSRRSRLLRDEFGQVVVPRHRRRDSTGRPVHDALVQPQRRSRWTRAGRAGPGDRRECGDRVARRPGPRSSGPASGQRLVVERFADRACRGEHRWWRIVARGRDGPAGVGTDVAALRILLARRNARNLRDSRPRYRRPGSGAAGHRPQLSSQRHRERRVMGELWAPMGQGL